MEILVLIDKLDDIVKNARPVPLTDQVRLDKQAIYDVLDEMRAELPEMLRQSGGAAPTSGVDEQALTAAVSAAIRENIPEIAQATAAQIGGSRQPPPGAPF